MIKTQPRNFIFDTVKMTAPERNGFDLSHENKQTCKAGFIYPFEILEALPNDDFQIQTEQLIRLQPMLSPTMHRLKSYWHWFFIPNRLVWNYWEEFISRGNGKKLPDNDEYTPPEPVVISLYDMIYCLRNRPFDSDDLDWIWNMIAKYYATDDMTKASNMFWSEESVNDRIQVLQACFPEFKFLRLRDTAAVTRFLVMCSTPRIATSMGVVDTSIPLFVLHINNSDRNLYIVPETYSPCDNGDANKFDSYVLYGTNNHDVADADIIKLEPLIKRLLSIKLSVMPFLAYMLIYNEYYRDENLIIELDEILNFFREETGQLDPYQNEVTFGFVSKMLNLFYRAWEKDYFTTCTTMPQKAPDVLIPNIPSADTLSVAADGSFRLKADGTYDTSIAYNPLYSNTRGNLTRDLGNSVFTSSAENMSYNGGLKIQSSNTSQGTTVADVRKAFALQRWFEKAVRTGTRYIETLKAFFNSDAGDARLQRPEYIGGSSEPIQISDTVQTSATADGSDTPQGNLAGYGISAGNSQVLTYHAPEHGFVIGCFSILARTSYAQQIPKLFSRETWLDYAFPEFEHIGEQGVQNKELFAAPLTKDILQVPHAADPNENLADSANQNFGYQSRYCEYKQINDRFGGAFARSLDFWSLGRIFSAPPSLSPQFVNANISERNFAVQSNDEEFLSDLAEFKKDVEDVDTDQYICDFWVDIKKVTSLTLFSEPI